MTLSKKIPASLLLFGISLMLITYAMLMKSESLLRNQTLSGLEREAKMLTTLIEQQLLDRYLDTLQFPSILEEMTPKTLKNIVSTQGFKESLDQLVNTNKDYRRIVIIDLDGNILAENSRSYQGKTFSTSNLEPDVITSSTWFKTLTDSASVEGDVYLYGPDRAIIDSSVNQYDILFGSRLYSESGNLVGLWLNILDFSVVESSVKDSYKILAGNGLPRLELTLLDSTGNVIVDYDPTSQQNAKYQRNFSVLSTLNLADAGVEGARLAVAGLSGTVVSTHARKSIEQFTAYTHFDGYGELPSLGWSTLIRLNEDEAYKDAIELRNWNVYIIIASLIVVVAMTFLAIKLFIQPLTKVTNAILEFSEGKLDSVIEPQSRTDEVGAINNALHRLKEKLQHREKLLKVTQEQQILLELQKNAIDSMTSGVVIADVSKPDFPVIFVNRAFEFLTGYRTEEVIGKPFRFLWGKDTDPLSTQIVDNAISKGEPCAAVLTNYRKNGTSFINNLLVDPVFNEHRELTHYIGVQNDITEIKRDDEIARFALEKKIAESTKESREIAKRLRTVFNTALDGSVVMNESGVIMDVNHSLEVIFGKTREEMLGKNVSILMTSAHANKHNQYIENYFNGGIRRFIGELRTVKALHNSGREIVIEISIGETKLEKEIIFVGAIRDITEQQEVKQKQKQLQSRLEEREIIYRTAFDQAAVGIARVGLDSNILEVNQKMCLDLGYSEQELLQLSVPAITFKDDLEMCQSSLSEMIEGKLSASTYDKRYVKKDGTVYWANLNISLVRSENGEPKYFISIVEDITQRKEFEQELKDARDEREELIGGINLASQAGGICNWSYNIIEDELRWDPSTYALYGVELGKPLTYSDWRERVFRDDIDELELRINHAIQNNEAFESEFRFNKKNNPECLWAKVALAVTYNEYGEPVKMFGINIDITQQKNTTLKLEQETKLAQHANESKSRFLATMSHEIRTPMNGVIGMIDLFKRTPLNADQKRMAATIRDSSFALLDIINDILDFSKIESGQIDIDWRPCSLLSLMEKTIDSMWVTAVDKNVELIIKPDLAIPKMIQLDPVKIRQIMLNLVGNAIKFSQNVEQAGVVTISTELDSDRTHILLNVIDNGIGISPEQQAHLFTPFTQADSSTTRKFGGTGLGLSISKSFIELMGGTINVESDIGKGSAFTIQFPLETLDSAGPEFIDCSFANYRFFLCVRNEVYKQCCLHLLSQLDCEGITEISALNDGQLPADTVKQCVLICDSPIDVSLLKTPIKSLVLETDPITKKGYATPYLFIVAAHPIKPSEMIHGLAILCGIATPDFQNDAREFTTRDSHFYLNEPIKEGFKILVVEDNTTNQLVIERQLTTLGYEFDISNNGQEGLEMWKRHNYSLILTDCHMPEMDGFELTEAVRTAETTQMLERIPIIAITANALVGEADNCIAAGMDDYLAKPVELERLKNKLLKWSGSAGKEQSLDGSVMLGDSNVLVAEKPKSLDINHLINIIGTDDKEIIDEILEMFWNTVQSEYEQLKTAVKEKKHAEIRSLAHAAKGSSASSGALYLTEIFQWIEKNSNDLDGLDEQIKLINIELEAIKLKLIDLNVI